MYTEEITYLKKIEKLNYEIQKKVKESKNKSLLLGVIALILLILSLRNFFLSPQIMVWCIIFFGGVTFWQFCNDIFEVDIQFLPKELISERDYFISEVTKIKYAKYKKALKIGRDYYSYVRCGQLSVYDEAAIKNDLEAMNI
jgi:hypothetical protein